MNEFNQLIMELKKKKLTKEMEEKFVKEYFKEEKKEKYNQLYEHYLNLVFSIAKKYESIDVDDAFQAGSIGLLNAFINYDINKDAYFTVYAKKCIEIEINNEYWKEQNFKLSKNKKKSIRKMKEFKNEFFSEMGREATEEEKKRELRMTTQEVRDLELLSSPSSSLNKEIKNDNGDVMTLADTLVSDCDISKDYEKEEIKEKIEEKINTYLNDEEKKVIIRYYGILKEPPLTLYEISKELNIEYKKADAILKSAMRKLRNNSKDLISYLD